MAEILILILILVWIGAVPTCEIAEMRYLIGEVDKGNSVRAIHEDPPIALEAAAGEEAGSRWRADGLKMEVRPLGGDADWRSDFELVFALDQGPTVGYRGFWSCPASER